MTLLNIIKYPDPFLRTTAEAVKEVDAAIKTLIENMAETMYRNKGIGLAAVQVGVAKRIIVLDVPDEDEEKREKGKNLLALVNPEVVEAEGSSTYEEGCLSLPGINADVKRAAVVTVRALDREGAPVEVKAEGLFSTALQHEIDHLDGILFIDKLSWLKRDFIKRKIKKSLEEEKRAV